MRIFSFSLYLLVCMTIFPFTGEAGVSLGAAPGETPGLKSDFQALQIKSQIARHLGEKVELRLFTSRADLLRHIEANKVDFAIVAPDFLATNSQKLVLVGPLDKSEDLLVVTGTPGEGDLSRRVAMALAKLVTKGVDDAGKETTISVASRDDMPAASESFSSMEPPTSASFGRDAAITQRQAPEEPSEASPVVEHPPESLPGAVADAANDHAAMSIASTATVESNEPLESAVPLPEVIAQPDIPVNLRPPNIPGAHSARALQAEPPQQPLQPPTAPAAGTPMLLLADGGSPVLLLSSESWGKTPRPAALLPEIDPEPNVIYVVPFITVMVPDEVREQVFDQFVDILNEWGAEKKKTFVIFKGKIDENSKKFLDSHKHVTGEIYGYVEDAGCCSTNIHTRIKLTCFQANDKNPVLEYEAKYKTFFDHDQTTLSNERKKLADKIVSTMTSEIMKIISSEKTMITGRVASL